VDLLTSGTILAAACIIAATAMVLRSSGNRDEAAARLLEPPAPLQSRVDPSIEQRVADLERDRPTFLVSMAELAERCEDVLDTAERKRRRAAATVSNEKRAQAAEDAQGELIDAQNAEHPRAAALRAVRARLERR
jgi:hypothetical protein